MPDHTSPQDTIRDTLEPADFFISYTRADETEAEWISWCLEDAGYCVDFQKWDFRPGNNFVLMMQKALRAKHTVCVLSTAYLEATFTQPEWAAALRDDPQGTARKLIPVRIDDCKPEGLLGPIIYIDLAKHLNSGDRDGAINELLNGVAEGRAKPETEPPFPARC